MQAAFFLLAALASTSAVMALKSSESLSSIQNALQYSQGMAYVERTAFVGGQLGRVSSLNAGAAVSAPSAPLRVSFCPVAMEGGKNCMRMYPPSLRVTRWGGAQRSRQVVLHAGNPEQEPTPVEAEVVNDEVFDPLGLGGGAGASGDFDANLAQRNLWEAVKLGDTEKIAFAVSKGADINHKYSEEGDASAIQCAALNGNTDAVAKLASLGANVNQCDKYKWTALHDAALNGHTETVAKLVSLGAKVDAKTDVEDDAPGAGLRTPLSNAAMNGHTETVRKLVSLGANVNERQKDGWTALHFAARNGWEETVEALVKLGIDPNVKNDVDMTALHYAAWDSTIETCQKLIDLGVDVNHKAKGKLSALELARKRRRELAGNKIAELLEKYSDVEKPSMEDESSPKTWEEWAPADPEWRKLIANDPYAQSITGREI